MYGTIFITIARFQGYTFLTGQYQSLKIWWARQVRFVSDLLPMNTKIQWSIKIFHLFYFSIHSLFPWSQTSVLTGKSLLQITHQTNLPSTPQGRTALYPNVFSRGSVSHMTTFELSITDIAGWPECPISRLDGSTAQTAYSSLMSLRST